MGNLTSFFTNLRWQDILDITLSAYILFRFYVLFRGTYVFRVMTGLGLLWIFQRLTSSLGLIVISWALQGITAVSAIIIIIVFRNELRRVLQAKNIRTLLWSFTSKQVDTPIEIIVKGVFELKKKHIGALIVFPGKEDLGSIIQKGVILDGHISKELLVSIFWPDNPVHDGAAIIMGNRVTEAGVILPLSSREDLPSYYGTRHRAAVGLVEITDALVIVVSEERAIITVAKDSKLNEVPNDLRLVQWLQDHLGMTQQSEMHRLKMKLKYGLAAFFSLIFISAIWFSFTRGMDTLITLEIPIEYMNRDPRMEIMNTSVNAVSLHISGSERLIKSIRPENLHARLDLSNATAGSNTYALSSEQITLPPGVVLKTINPSKVEVTLDIQGKKELPIQVNWVGKLPENLILERVKLNPEAVMVTGGNLELNEIATIYTKPVHLEDLKESGVMSVDLALTNTSVQIPPTAPDAVLVEYKIKKRPGAGTEQPPPDL